MIDETSVQPADVGKGTHEIPTRVTLYVHKHDLKFSRVSGMTVNKLRIILL